MSGMHALRIWVCCVCFFYLICLTATIQAQTPVIVNSYAKVTAFPGCIPCLSSCNKVQVDDISAFAVGNKTLLIQMKGAEISWAQDSTFGTINNYGSAGFHEVLTIAAVNPGTKTITFTSPIAGTYDVAGKVQLVKQFYSAVSYTVPAAGISCLPWDGDKGGVLFMEVNGTLNLNGMVDVTGKGFRGADNPNSNIDTAVCGTGGPLGDIFSPGIFYLDYASRQWAGRKGEGIAEFRNPQYELGRGPLASGGGGGLNHNSGGGGGANMGYGGLGGGPYVGLNETVCGVRSNGMGGKILDRMGGLRLYLGGGGGAGHENNNRGNSGGNGGGIIIIKANAIEGNGFKIITDGFIGFNYAGVNGGRGGNDGGGGGGAGGSIKIDCANFGTTSLIFQARGGDGGSLDVDPSNAHGPGGGGGGGLVCFAASAINNPLVTVVSTGGNAGVLNDDLSTNGAMPGGNGLTAFSCSSISAVPPSQIPFTLGPDQLICANPIITLDTKLNNSLYTFAWYHNGSLLAGQQDSFYVTNLPGKFAVRVTTPFCTSTDTILITKKGTETPVNQTFCAASGPVSVTLSLANTVPGANYGWYTAAVGGTFLGLGTSYTIPSLSKDTILYVVDTNKVVTTIGPDGSASAQVYYVGGPGGSNITLQEHHRRFTVLNTMKLKSVEVIPALNAGGCGYNTTFSRSLTIRVYQNGLPTALSVTATVPCGVMSKVVTNLTIPPGTNYELRVEGIGNGDLMMNDQYIPYEVPDVLSIKSNTAKSGVFFNWEIEYGATCARIPVWAKQNCPLPVSLLSFDGMHGDRFNRIYWQTADEIHISRYIVQRSEDAIHFTDVYSVAAAGSGWYEYKDVTQVAHEYYYRLLIVEDGKPASYSRVIYLGTEPDDLFSLFPNPANTVLNIHFSKAVKECYVTIWDVTGKKVSYKEVMTIEDIYSLALDITAIPSGIYFIQCFSPSGISESMKFEVIK